MIKRYSNAFGFNYVTVASIIWCESGFDENAIHVNNDKLKTRDIGIWQINEYYHYKEALKLGYNIFVPEENLAYGFVLLKTLGITPWKASLICIGNYNEQT